MAIKLSHKKLFSNNNDITTYRVITREETGDGVSTTVKVISSEEIEIDGRRGKELEIQTVNGVAVVGIKPTSSDHAEIIFQLADNPIEATEPEKVETGRAKSRDSSKHKWHARGQRAQVAAWTLATAAALGAFILYRIGWYRTHEFPWSVILILAVVAAVSYMTKWKILRPLSTVTAVTAIILLLYNFATYPASAAAPNFVDEACGAEELAQVGQAAPGIKNLIGGDHRVFAEALKGFASTGAQRQTDCDAAKSRVTRKIPIIHGNFVSGLDKSWTEKFTASEPLLLTFSKNEVMCSGDRSSECWHVDGMYHGGTPSWMKGNLTVMQNPDPKWGGMTGGPSGSYGAVLIRTCAGGSCFSGRETGFAAAVCPTDQLTTTASFITNKYTTVGPTRTNEDFNSLEKFSFEVRPWNAPEAGVLGLTAKAACDANPSAGFVRLATPTT